MFGIDDAIAAGLKVLDKFIPDPEAKIKAEAELRESLLRWDEGQTRVNEAEAIHRNIFVAGWRPFIGWVCGTAFAFHYVVVPIAEVVSKYLGYPFPVITFDMNSLLTVLLGMLGLGGMRSWEKIKGVAK